MSNTNTWHSTWHHILHIACSVIRAGIVFLTQSKKLISQLKNYAIVYSVACVSTKGGIQHVMIVYSVVRVSTNSTCHDTLYNVVSVSIHKEWYSTCHDLTQRFLMRMANIIVLSHLRIFLL